MNTGTITQLFDSYCEATGKSHWRAGALAVNDGKFFTRISAGGSCTIRTYNKVLQWFSDNWPADLDWPSNIERPAPNKAAA